MYVLRGVSGGRCTYAKYESERIEYKSQMIDDIYKEVIAFANIDGGTPRWINLYAVADTHFSIVNRTIDSFNLVCFTKLTF